jgi:hypothetical protein
MPMCAANVCVDFRFGRIGGSGQILMALVRLHTLRRRPSPPRPVGSRQHLVRTQVVPKRDEALRELNAFTTVARISGHT